MIEVTLMLGWEADTLSHDGWQYDANADGSFTLPQEVYLDLRARGITMTYLYETEAESDPDEEAEEDGKVTGTPEVDSSLTGVPVPVVFGTAPPPTMFEQNPAPVVVIHPPHPEPVIDPNSVENPLTEVRVPLDKADEIKSELTPPRETTVEPVKPVVHEEKPEKSEKTEKPKK